MKSTLILSILFMLMFVSCTKDEPSVSEFALNNFAFSDCKYEKGTVINEHESVVYHCVDGNQLFLKHTNVLFNCCQTENSLTVETQMIADSIFIREFEKEPGLCNCICPYDMECTVGPLQKKHYWIIVKKSDTESFRFLINFDEKLEGVKSL